MESKKINQLATNVNPQTSDLTTIGDPITGQLKKITWLQVAHLIGAQAAVTLQQVTDNGNTTTDPITTGGLTLTNLGTGLPRLTNGEFVSTYGYGLANGVATLDSGGKIPASQLPSSVMEYKGTWNASTNTPTLADGTGDNGDVYLVNVAGSQNLGSGTISFAVGDWVVYNGTIWQKSLNSNAVSSVFGRTGTITAQEGDYTIDQLGDVAITTPATNDYLRYNGTGWVNTQFPTFVSSDKLVLQVRNNSGATINKGTVVYINGATAGYPTIAKAQANQDSTSAQTLGLVQDNISNNSNGIVVLVGQITGIDTSAYPAGTQLYLSGTTAGAFTSTKTLAPTHLVYVGIVTAQNAVNGVIEVKIQNGYELDEIHDVAISSVANNQGLFYESSTSLWKNKSIATVLGYTPEQPLTFSSPLVRTTNTISIPAATGSVNGYLTSTDWTTFNNKITNPMTTLGDIIFGGTSGNPNRLAGNITTTKQYLSQTGTGTDSASPTWATITGSDITGAALTKTDDTNVTLTLGGNPSTALLRAASLTLGWTGQLSVSRGGTGLSALGTAGQLLRVNTGATALEYFTPTYISAAITSLNGLTVATQTFATGTAGTDFAISSASGVHTFNLPIASATNTGKLSSTDWTTFNGKLTNPMTTLGDIIYGGASGTGTRLAGNITTTKQYLSQTGNGTASAAPSWATISGSDITGAALTETDDTNVTLTLGGTPSTALLRAVSLTLGWTGQLSVTRGGTGLSSLGTAGQLIRVNSGATALEYFTPSYLTSVSWSDIIAGTRTNYNLKFRPPADDFAGFEFLNSAGIGAGFLLIRGNTDSGEVYKANGITLVADGGWLTLAQRGSSDVGLRLMTGVTSTERFRITTAGVIEVVNCTGFTTDTTITSTINGTALIMNGGSSAQGIQMRASTSSTYPVFLRSLNPTGGGETSAWLFKEDATAWGIWHNNPDNTIDFTRDTTTGIANNVGGGTNTVMIRLNMSNGSAQFAGSILNRTGTAILDQNGNITGNAATATLATTATTATTANSVAWTNISSGNRENFEIGFRPSNNSNSYAGLKFSTVGNDADAGYMLIRGGLDSDIYTENGITLVADKGWLTLAQRTTASRGVQIMTGAATSTTRLRVTTAGVTEFVNGTGFTYNGNTIWHSGNLTNNNQLSNGAGYLTSVNWSQIASGVRSNFNLVFRAPTDDFAGFEFQDPTGTGAGFFLIRGTSDGGVYTANGIALVADGGWLSLVQRTQSSRGIRFLAGSGGAPPVRMQITSAGVIELLTSTTSTSSITASGGFFDTSDIRVKNIIERNPILDINVDLVKYTKKGDNSIRYGYIAQEVQNINGDVVGGNEILTLNYQDIHSIKIAALEREIKELKSKLN